MHVDTVGDEIVDTLYSGYGRTIYLPRILGFLTWIVRTLFTLARIIKKLTREIARSS